MHKAIVKMYYSAAHWVGDHMYISLSPIFQTGMKTSATPNNLVFLVNIPFTATTAFIWYDAIKMLEYNSNAITHFKA